MNLPRFVGVKQTKAEPDGIRIKAVIKAVSPPAWLLVGVWQRGGEKENNRMSASLLVPPHSNPGRRRGNAEEDRAGRDVQETDDEERWRARSRESSHLTSTSTIIFYSRCLYRVEHGRKVLEALCSSKGESPATWWESRVQSVRVMKQPAEKKRAVLSHKVLKWKLSEEHVKTVQESSNRRATSFWAFEGKQEQHLLKDKLTFPLG